MRMVIRLYGIADGKTRHGLFRLMPMEDVEAAASRKRKRCAHADNELLVEELLKLRSRVRESTHLSFSYQRAITSIQLHTERISNGKEAKQLKHIGNYMANQIQSVIQKQRLGGQLPTYQPPASAPPVLATTAPAPAPAPAAPAPPVPPRRPVAEPQHQQAPPRPAPLILTQNVPPVALAESSDSRNAQRIYAPSYRKQPWYVLLVLDQEQAQKEAGAIAIDALLLKMQQAGYEGTLPKLKTCIASLQGTHQVVRKTSSGLIYLSDKGRQSVTLCPGSLAAPVAGAPTRSTTLESTPTLPAPQPTCAMAAEPEVLRREEPCVISSPSQVAALLPPAPRTTAPVTPDYVVCIDSSDSEPPSDAETIRASASPRSFEEEEEEEEEDNFFDDAGYEFYSEQEPELELTPPSPQQEPQQPIWTQQSEPSTMASFSHSTPIQESVDDSMPASTNYPEWMQPTDEWELVLILDHREILSRRNRSILERMLLERHVTCEVRSLNVGDVQWIARRYRDGGFTEFMVNVIVERKEVRDLSGSIIDRRYTEQKTRLRACGVTHVIYLVEGSLTQQTTVRTGGLQTALCRTQVQNQFFVQLCQNADDSVSFLAAVHARLLATMPHARCRNPEKAPHWSDQSQRMHLPLRPPSTSFERLLCRPLQTFTEFNASFRKKTQFTVGELVQMMLTQVPGMSTSKTSGLTGTHATFHQLRAALVAKNTNPKSKSAAARADEVANIRCGETQRRLGTKTREQLAQLLTTTDYDQLSMNATSGNNII